MTTNNGQARKAGKAIKAARLATSEASLGNDDASSHMGATAGRLAQVAGMRLDDLATAVPGLCRCPAWDAAVDAWYSAQDQADLALPPADLEDAAAKIDALRASSEEGTRFYAETMAQLLAEVRRARAAR